MATRAGKLDHRLTFMQLQRVADGGGGFVDTWVDVFTCYGSHDYIGGSEGPYAGQVVETNQLKSRIRYRAGITSAMRVRIDGIIYDLHTVQEVGRRVWLDLKGAEIEAL